jgi:hypothetical protein
MGSLRQAQDDIVDLYFHPSKRSFFITIFTAYFAIVKLSLAFADEGSIEVY